ncbi:hypothetical protein Q5741_02625 [Paenibacillus sp. JX-17]|uniref:Uncharacterized protein n=1 Tax=Paenibacillus lacisoli TaxID=3064525 RepID=A0ABT9CBE6_9BACL|nr:hypothetical protein [Paenibacillus sp. JX-17]MDO7905307.1 hypothetical protein [Paenibacillus sp. JX-17]
MLRTRVKTYKHRIGKKKVLVVKVYQSARAKAKHGNALASNMLNIKIAKGKHKAKHRKHHHHFKPHRKHHYFKPHRKHHCKPRHHRYY